MKNRSIFQTMTLIVCFTLSSASFAGDKNQVVQLQVDGMISNACPVILRSAVRKIKGVKKVEASLKNHSATIEYDGKQTSLKQIQAVIKAKAGFKTRVRPKAQPQARMMQKQ